LGGNGDSQCDHGGIEEEDDIEEGKFDKSGGREKREKKVGEEVKRNDQRGKGLREVNSPTK
jgi:hypothetical protein